LFAIAVILVWIFLPLLVIYELIFQMNAWRKKTIRLYRLPGLRRNRQK
jgi:hypothetical protein